MIREVQRIDHIEIDAERYTATFAGMTVPLSVITVTEGEDSGRKRLTVNYNNEVYVLRSHASDKDEQKADEKRIQATWKEYNQALKKREKERNKKPGKLETLKKQMQNVQENALRIDKRNGTVHFAGKTVSALDVRMEVSEYSGMKRLTLEYDNQLYAMQPNAGTGAVAQKISNARIDKVYNDYLKARERALDI